MSSIISFFSFVLLFITLPIQPFAQALKSYQLTSKGDTVNRIDKNDMKQGPWIRRFEEIRGEQGFEEEGVYKDDKKEGTWNKFNLDGDLIGIEFFRWGNRDGKQQYFTRNGGLYREESWKALNPTNPYDTVIVPDLDNPNVMVEKIVKQESAEVRHGIWNYYDPGLGKLMKTEKFFYGRIEGPKNNLPPKNNADTIGAQSNPIPKTKPKEVVDFEKSKKSKPKVKT